MPVGKMVQQIIEREYAQLFFQKIATLRPHTF
jgi:hypothetical protein